MIPEWCTPSERIEFLKSSFGRQPYAQPAAARSSVSLLGWKTLDRVLSAPNQPDVLTVREGRLVDVASPRSADDVRALMAEGISTVIRASERHDEGLRRLADSFKAVCHP